MRSKDETTIANAILTAPGWARVGITAPTEHMREEAARELARAVLTEGGGEGEALPSDQLPLDL